MAPAPIPRELLLSIASAGNDLERAADFIEEYILHRRSKGDSLYEVSNSLVELESKVPARSVPAIRQAQYATNVPPASDLTPPSGPSHRSSASPQTVLAFLLSEPAPAVQHAREVILEYVLAREARLRDKNHGRGGKGTLGRDGFEEIAARLGEIEDGLRGKGPLAAAAAANRRGAPTPAPGTPDDELPPSRQLGLALVLSLRMLLSYFSLVDLGRQLLSQTPQDAVRTLVQHIRRRVPGEGRYNVGKELEYVESLTLHRRPTLRPAFRSARQRTHLPPRALYPISLPAPSKSACIKLLNAFIRDVDQAGPAAASSYMGPQGQQSLPAPRKKSSPLLGGVSPGSPVSPILSPGSPVRGTNLPSPTDPTPIESYTLELVSEFLTREKREYMSKNKWAKSGREQLGKDLFDIESALCVSSKGMPTTHCGILLPVFLLLRRTFSLPATPLPNAIIGSAYDMLPMPPEPDGVPLQEPSVSSTTAALYVNPRLSDRDALDIVEELLESERERGINAAVSEEKTVAWLLGQVDQVQKRFPDGSYQTVFEQARLIASHPRAWPDASTSSAFPSHPLVSGPGHRRTKSSAVASPTRDEVRDVPPVPSPKSHMRSASMPLRASTHSELSAPRSTGDGVSPALSAQAVRDSESSVNDPDSSSDLDAAFARRVAQVDSLGLVTQDTDVRSSPAASNYTRETSTTSKATHGRERSNTSSSTHRHTPSSGRERSNTTPSNRDRSNSNRANVRGMPNIVSVRSKPPPPPLLNLNMPYQGISTELSDFMEPEPEPPASASSVATPLSASSVGGTSEGGWWDVISAASGSPAPRRSPLLPDSRRDSETQAPESPLATTSLPPGAASPVVNGVLNKTSGPESATTPTSRADGTFMLPALDTTQRGLNLDFDAGGLTGPFGTITGRNAPSTLTSAEADHAAAAAAAIAATEAKLAGSTPSSAATTPRTTPTMLSSARVEAGPPVPRVDSDEEEQLKEFGAAAPAASPNSGAAPPLSAPPLTGSIGPRPGRPSRELGETRLPGSQQPLSAPAARPPPVPLTIDRPNFPSARPANGPQSAREHKDMPPPAVDHASMGTTTKLKLGSFGRSMSLSARHVMGRSKDKEKEKEKEKEVQKANERLARKGTLRPGAITNNPERWNRDMVVGIMGPPVERK